jgi:hypothetical protein
MNTWKKLAALLAAGALGLALAGTALAVTGASDQGVTPTLHADANITIDGNGNSDAAECDAADAIETGNTSGSDTTDNGVTVTWTYDDATKAFSFTASGGLVTIAYIKGGNDYNEYNYVDALGHGVDSDGNMFAPDNASGGPAGLSHAVFCTEDVEESAPPSFEASEAAETDVPSEPPTDTIGGKAGTSGPADGAWLLVVALGVLLGSIVVLTPARAKSQR